MTTIVKLGKLQNDAGHRAATFMRSEILSMGKLGVQSWNRIYYNLQNGNQWFSTMVNPWTKTIFHEAPGKVAK